MDLTKISRLRAFSIHFAISSVIFLAIAALMIFSWFPGQFFWADGGWQSMRIVAGVDLVLGPAFTLLLFNSIKKTHKALLLDVSVIGLCQVLALTVGVWISYQQRTVAVVYSEDQFYSIAHEALAKANNQLEEAGKPILDINDLSDSKPRELMIRRLSQNEVGDYLVDIFNGLPEIKLRSDFYAGVFDNWDRLAEFALTEQSLVEKFPTVKTELARRELQVDDYAFFKMKLRYGNAIAGFAKESKHLEILIPYEAKNSVD